MSNPTILLEQQFILAKQGDKKAFEELYLNLFTPVYRFIYVRVRNKELAEDICHAVFLKTLESLPRHSSSNNSPIAYFLTAARNTLIDHWRKKKDATLAHSTEEDEPEIASTLKGPHETLVEAEQTKELYEAMQNLNDEQREVLILKYINDRSTDEIANILDKSNDAVRQIQSRAIKQLRSHYKPVT